MSKLSDGIKAFFSANDEWTGRDKKLHLAAGFLASFIVTVTTGNTALGFGAGIAAAAGKEIYDIANPLTHTPSYKDFVVTVVGAAAGTIVGGLVSKAPWIMQLLPT